MAPLRLVRAYGLALPVGPPVTDRRRFGVPPGGAFDDESRRLANALAGLPEEATVWEVAGQAEFEAQEDGTVAAVGSTENRAWRVAAGGRITVGGMRTYVAFGQGPARRLAEPPSSLRGGPLRVVPGPQADLVRLGGSFTVSPASNRVGIRLDGEGFTHDLELPSEPACVGAIQVTNSGQPIILGPDGPTIGGYPKAAVVIRADLPRLAHLIPGAPVELEWVGFDEADAAFREQERTLEQRLAELRWAV